MLYDDVKRVYALYLTMIQKEKNTADNNSAFVCDNCEWAFGRSAFSENAPTAEMWILGEITNNILRVLAYIFHAPES